MIFTQENEYAAVLDACVLVPMALCDLLLRLAEEPAMYRPLWSEQILTELARALKTKLRRSAESTSRKTVSINTECFARRRMIFCLISTISTRS